MKDKNNFLLSGTSMFIYFILGDIFFKIPKNLIASAFFLPRQILKNIDMPQQKPQYLPTAKGNFEYWVQVAANFTQVVS